MCIIMIKDCVKLNMDNVCSQIKSWNIYSDFIFFLKHNAWLKNGCYIAILILVFSCCLAM